MVNVERFSAADEVLSARKEVQEFARAAETLLSPALLQRELTEGECLVIAEYVKTLSHSKNPWSASLELRYA